MTTERFVGLLFLTGVFVFLVFIFYPDVTERNTSIIKQEYSSTEEDGFKEFKESDFDF